MPNTRVCVRFRPLDWKESVRFRPLDWKEKTCCIRPIDHKSFIIQEENEKQHLFCFDKVFYERSEQADIYEFLAFPIVKGAFNGVDGAVIMYGQSGSGKTYSLEGPNITIGGKERGLLQRVADGIFKLAENSDGMSDNAVKLSMVEICMDQKVRDLFDLSKDNLQINESRELGFSVCGVTEISISDSAGALHNLAIGIANRTARGTQMNNMASSRSHCIYIFSIQQELKSGKVILVDLAASEKTKKTAATSRILEEAKTVNRSMSALKLTQILLDNLGGNSQTMLLCCCSPSPSDALESLSTSRFGSSLRNFTGGIPDGPRMGDVNTCLGFIFYDLSGNRQMIMGVDTLATTATVTNVAHSCIRPKTLLLMAGDGSLCHLWFNVVKQSLDKVLPQCALFQLAQKIHCMLKGLHVLPAYHGAIIGGWDNDIPYLINDASERSMEADIGCVAKVLGSGGIYANHIIQNRLCGPMSLGDAVHMTKMALTYASHMDPRTGGFAKVFYSANPSSEWDCISTESLDILKSTYDVNHCDAFIRGIV